MDDLGERVFDFQLKRLLELTNSDSLQDAIKTVERVFKKTTDQAIYKAYLYAYIRVASGHSTSEAMFGSLEETTATALGVQDARANVQTEWMAVLLKRVGKKLQTQPVDST